MIIASSNVTTIHEASSYLGHIKHKHFIAYVISILQAVYLSFMDGAARIIEKTADMTLRNMTFI